MKKTLLLLLLISIGPCSIFVTKGQTSSSLSENFDVVCATSDLSLHSLTVWNPVAANWPDGGWACDQNTKDHTPCMQCSGFFNGSYHSDTSWLLFNTGLILTAYIGKPYYLQFDAKTSNVSASGKLSLLSAPTSDPGSATDISSGLAPALGLLDTNWTTHQYNLSSLIHPDHDTVYIQFRYVSMAGSGSTWFLDNVRTSATPLEVGNINKEVLPLTVLGNSTSSEISVSYSVPEAGAYYLSIQDMVGREVHKELINARSGQANYTIADLRLNKGLYLIKMGNESTYGVTRAAIW